MGDYDRAIAETFGIAACTFGIMTLFGYTFNNENSHIIRYGSSAIGARGATRTRDPLLRKQML